MVKRHEMTKCWQNLDLMINRATRQKAQVYVYRGTRLTAGPCVLGEGSLGKTRVFGVPVSGV